MPKPPSAARSALRGQPPARDQQAGGSGRRRAWSRGRPASSPQPRPISNKNTTSPATSIWAWSAGSMLSVSGVLVLARTSKAAARLNDQFRERTAKKIYWAVVDEAARSAARRADRLAEEGREAAEDGRRFAAHHRRPAGRARLSHTEQAAAGLPRRNRAAHGPQASDSRAACRIWAARSSAIASTAAAESCRRESPCTPTRLRSSTR